MATNLKGQGGIKGFLLLHGEKIAMGVVAAVALWFVYKSLKVPRLDDQYQAPRLQSEISQTSAQIKDFTWTEAVDKYPDKVKKAEPIAAKSDLIVKSDNYNTSSAMFDGSVVAPMIVRADPDLLNAKDLRATGGSGLFAFADAKIRREQELRKAAEQAERERKAEERQRKEQQKQKEGAAGGKGRNRPEGPGPGESLPAELIDPAHPNRRMVGGTAQMFGVPLQGGERIERAYWACVVAKVPIREQFKRYEDAFKEARGYDQAQDFPRYVGFLVERAEVLPGKPLDWKRVPLYDGQHQSVVANKPIAQVVNQDAVNALMNAAQQFWAGMSPDVIDPRFSDYVLTLPLPPLVGRAWGSNASHPDIPMGNLPAAEEEAQPQPVAPSSAVPGTTDENASFSSSSPFASGVPAGPGYGAPGRMPIGPGQNLGYRRQPYGPGEGGRYRGPGPESYRGPTAGPGDKTTLTRGVDFWLLRFFDYTVEPGKRYKYRVKLALADPNANHPASVLAPAVLDRLAKAPRDRDGRKMDVRVLDSWSEPSPTVGIPMAGNIRLADVKIPSAEKFNDEPSVTVLVESFDVDNNGNAIQAAVEKKDFRRGYVANLIEDAKYLAEGGQVIDTQHDFKFLTGMTMLDLDGGAKLAKDLTAPVRIMVMGPSGQLYIRNEIDDKPFVDYHRELFDKSLDKHRGPGGPDEFGRGPVGRPGRK